MATNKIPSRNNRIIGINYDNVLEDVNELSETYIGYMYARTLRMFNYENLPDYIPVRDVERILQTFRFIYFKKVDDKIYGFFGGLGGIPNAYYQPTKVVISNPYLKYYESVDLTDEENGVLIWNDSAHIGLNALNQRYAKMMAHCDISLKRGLVNSRIPSVFVVKNDNDVKAIQDFFKDVENGTMKGIFNTDSLLYENGIDIKSFQNNQPLLTSLIETRQYYYASWLNELGIQANYNMKREAINGAESGMNEEALKPLVDDMLLCRIEGIEKFNKLFGTNVKVTYNSAWVERKKVGEDIESITEDPENVEGGKEDENETL